MRCPGSELDTSGDWSFCVAICQQKAHAASSEERWGGGGGGGVGRGRKVMISVFCTRHFWHAVDNMGVTGYTAARWS
jgi:hypothetical protein